VEERVVSRMIPRREDAYNNVDACNTVEERRFSAA
jgi:hypothetical protein